MAIRAVVLDIGGVLSTTPGTDVYAKWDDLLKLNAGEFAERLGAVWGEGALKIIPEEELQRRLSETMGMDTAQCAAFTEEFWVEYLGELNTELADFFANLRPRYKTGILSNSFTGAREREQARYRFEDMADVIIYSHEVGLSKPGHRIFELTCQRLGVQPDEMIFVDNHEPHVLAARELGICGIHFKDTAQVIAEIKANLNG